MTTSPTAIPAGTTTISTMKMRRMTRKMMTTTTTTEDDEYIENAPQVTHFDVQLPKKMTRLLQHRYRPPVRQDQPIKPRPIRPRVRLRLLSARVRILPVSFLAVPYVLGSQRKSRFSPRLCQRRWSSRSPDEIRRDQFQANAEDRSPLERRSTAQPTEDHQPEAKQ